MSSALERLVGEMTLAELASKSKRSVDQIVSFALANGSSAPSRAARPLPAKAPASKGARGGTVNTRSAAGRNAYEQAVYDTVATARGKISAPEIRARVGGTPMQARAALNRLIEDRKITYEGRARATRYSVA